MVVQVVGAWVAGQLLGTVATGIGLGVFDAPSTWKKQRKKILAVDAARTARTGEIRDEEFGWISQDAFVAPIPELPPPVVRVPAPVPVEIPIIPAIIRGAGGIVGGILWPSETASDDTIPAPQPQPPRTPPFVPEPPPFPEPEPFPLPSFDPAPIRFPGFRWPNDLPEPVVRPVEFPEPPPVPRYFPRVDPVPVPEIPYEDEPFPDPQPVEQPRPSPRDDPTGDPIPSPRTPAAPKAPPRGFPLDLPPFIPWLDPPSTRPGRRTRPRANPFPDPPPFPQPGDVPERFDWPDPGDFPQPWEPPDFNPTPEPPGQVWLTPLQDPEVPFQRQPQDLPSEYELNDPCRRAGNRRKKRDKKKRKGRTVCTRGTYVETDKRTNKRRLKRVDCKTGKELGDVPKRTRKKKSANVVGFLGGIAGGDSIGKAITDFGVGQIDDWIERSDKRAKQAAKERRALTRKRLKAIRRRNKRVNRKRI